MPAEPVRLCRHAFIVSVLLAACSGDDEKPRRTPGSGAASGTGGAGAAGGAAGSVGGAAGDSGAGGLSGTGGGADAGEDGGAPGEDAAPAVCGNGVAEGEEEPCDGDDLRGRTCASEGFQIGSLACSDCSIDSSGCSGTEDCFDVRDNDGDSDVDCNDSDCSGACADSCAASVAILDPSAKVTGSTVGHASVLAPSCLRAGVSSGPEVVYRITAQRTGVLDVLVTASVADLNVSVRTDCASAASELGCVESSAGSGAIEWLRVRIDQGQTVFVVVDGTGASQAGVFSLDVTSRAIRCGDGFRDPGEECEDGNETSNDGCSASCMLEPDETEDNGSTTQANTYTGHPYFAAISPAGDVDVFSFAVATAGSTLSAETFDLGDGACSKDLLDSRVEILGTNGTTVLASNDDGGAGFCSVAVASGLAQGQYFVRVTGAPATPTFPYVLNVSSSP